MLTNFCQEHCGVGSHAASHPGQGGVDRAEVQSTVKRGSRRKEGSRKMCEEEAQPSVEERQGSSGPAAGGNLLKRQEKEAVPDQGDTGLRRVAHSGQWIWEWGMGEEAEKTDRQTRFHFKGHSFFTRGCVDSPLRCWLPFLHQEPCLCYRESRKQGSRRPYS